MSTIPLTVDEIYALVQQRLLANGCNEENAAARTISSAESL